MAHDARHVQHQIAGTSSGIVDADRVGVVVLQELAHRVLGLVDQAEQLVDVACHQRSGCFVHQQFGLFRNQTQRGHQRARRIAGPVERTDATLVITGGSSQFVEDVVGSESIDQPAFNRPIEQCQESLVGRALQDVVAVVFYVVGQLCVACGTSHVLDVTQLLACALGDTATLQDMSRNKHGPNRCRATLGFAPCPIGRRQPRQDAGWRFVTAGNHIGRVVAVAFEIDVHSHRCLIARCQRITLTDIALRRAVADHRHAEGKRHAAVLPDARCGAQGVFVVKQMRRMVSRALNDAHTQPVGRQAFDDGCL